FAGYGGLVMLTAPEAVKDVFRGDGHALHSGEGNEFLSGMVGTSSGLVLDEEPHARQRRGRAAPRQGQRGRCGFCAAPRRPAAGVGSWPPGRPIGMAEPMRQITRRVILQAVLGLAPGPQLEDFEGKVGRLLAFGRSRYALILVKLVPQRLLRGSRWLPYFRQ